jgi:hypothetical protein
VIDSAADRRPGMGTGAGRTALVSSHYYPSYLEASMRFARRAAAQVGAAVCVFVASRPELMEGLRKMTEKLPCEGRVRNHDNVGLEFGAYQRGIDALPDLASFDWVLILNDSCSLHESFAAQHLANAAQQMQWRPTVTSPVAIGKSEGLERSFVIEGLRSHRWLTTNLFALNQSAVRGLGGRLYCPQLESLVTAGAEVGRFFGPNVDEALREHIAGWLFDPSAPFHWYRAAPLSSANSTMFALKARSILQEIHLGARLESLSTAFVDIKELRRWQRWARRVLPSMPARLQR